MSRKVSLSVRLKTWLFWHVALPIRELLGEYRSPEILGYPYVTKPTPSDLRSELRRQFNLNKITDFDIQKSALKS